MRGAIPRVPAQRSRVLKRLVKSPAAGGSRLMAAFDVYGGFQMDIFVYSDESGVFDCYHSQYFVFGGVAFLDRETMESAARRYLTVEREIRKENLISSEDELKASNLERKNQRRLFRTTNREFRFGVVVEIPKLKIRWQIADDKKSRQRYMDFAYKIAIKRFFASLIQDGAINPAEVNTIHFFTDQHTTATNGRYELNESLEQELIRGSFNFEKQIFHPPLFPTAKSTTLKYCDSKKVVLIRAADIIANRIYHLAHTGNLRYEEDPHFFVYALPDNDLKKDNQD